MAELPQPPPAQVPAPGAGVTLADAAERSASLAALRGAHVFPGSFAFKAIGANTPAFAAAVVEAATQVLGAAAQPQVTTRPSAQGRHQAVHLTVQVQRAEQVLATYAALQKLPGLAMLL